MVPYKRGQVGGDEPLLLVDLLDVSLEQRLGLRPGARRVTHLLEATVGRVVR